MPKQASDFNCKADSTEKCLACPDNSSQDMTAFSLNVVCLSQLLTVHCPTNRLCRSCKFSKHNATYTLLHLHHSKHWHATDCKACHAAGQGISKQVQQGCPLHQQCQGTGAVVNYTHQDKTLTAAHFRQGAHAPPCSHFCRLTTFDVRKPHWPTITLHTPLGPLPLLIVFRAFCKETMVRCLSDT